MRKIVVSQLVSLDGVMENPEWSAPYTGQDQLKFKFAEIQDADMLLLGRIGFQEFADAWPNVPDDGGFLPVGFAARMNSLPKMVASTTLHDPLPWNGTVIQGNVVEAVKRLREQPGKDILVISSAELVETLMKNDLVDEYRLLMFPVVVGKGKRVFKEGITARLELVEATPYDTGSVMLIYRRGPQQA